MLNFCSLYSGSTGNSLFLESDNTKLLIDAGESAKKISEALENINVDIKSLDGILVTHEHSDHVKSIGTIAQKYNIPVYANLETWNAMASQKNKIKNPDNIKLFSVNEKFNINDIEINPFSIPHDAANPCGFNFFHKNYKLSVATDIGHMTNDIIENLKDSSFLLLESNYDLNILKCSKYPYSLKQRISGPNGHLSNDMAGKTIRYLKNFGLKNVVLGHLSKENNFPELAYKTVVEELINNSINENDMHISVATRYKSTPLFNLL